MQRRTLVYLLFSAPALTLLAVLVHSFLPGRTYSVLDEYTGYTYLYSDRVTGEGTSETKWIDKSHNHWRCDLRDGTTYPFCGFSVLITKNQISGVDLSKYHYLEVDIAYKGPAEKIRLHMRNFNPVYSSLDSDDRNKFNYVMLETSALNAPLNVQLSDFAVADWWIEKFDIPRKYSHPEYNNIITVGIDFGQPFPFGANEITVNKLTFVGEPISKANWYLGILSAWIISFLGIGSYLLVQNVKQSKKDARLIRELADYNEKLQSQSETYKNLSRIDPLTKVFNRFGFTQMVEQITPNLSPSNAASLIMITLLDFNQLQRSGHDSCDAILSDSADLIRQHCRANFSIARWEREEFLVLCPDLMGARAYQVAEKIRQGFHHYRPVIGNVKAVRVFCTVLEIQPGVSFADSLRQLDEARQRAQNLGINTTFLAG